MHTYWIILILTSNSTPNVPPHVNLNIKLCLIIMEITICLIIMQILYTCQSYNVVTSIHTKLKFSFVILKYAGYQKKPSHIIPKYAEYQKRPSCKCIWYCICHSIVKLLYIGKGKTGKKKLGTEELRCTSLCTTTIYIELYVCFIACYYELLMLILYKL